MKNDHEFDPVTPEELAEREREADLARKIRREVVRVQKGEADEDLKADEEAEQEQKAEAEAAERKEKKRQSSALWQIFSGSILVREGSAGYYPYLISIAVMFFLSIVVMFSALHLDMRYSRLERDVQLLRERSIRIEEQRYRFTTHSAITERLRERGLELYDPLTPSEIIEEQ